MAAVLTHALGICNDLYSQILAKSNAPLLMNRQQCMLLSERLSEVKQTLQEVQHSIGPQSPNAVPAMQELVHVLLKTQKTIVNDCFCGEKWLETAIRQGGDLKETFAEILFDLRWLCNILKVVVGQDSQVLQLADCDRTLCESEVNNLFRAAKKDQEDLKSFLLKGDHTCCGQSCCIERTSMECLATQLLKKLEFQTEFQAWSTTEKKNYLAGLSTREKTKYLAGLHAKNLCELLHVLSINEQDLKKDRELLGESGNGTVEKVDWLGESYAIKTSKYGSEMFLLQEIVNLSVVNHPHVMHLVCCVKEVTARSYIMERMNKSLSKMLENIQLSLTRRVDIMLQIAEGINSLHSMGLVHRDLKPDNILIKCERCGSESSTSTSMVQEPLWIAKVCDFGTTKMKLESTAYANQTIPIGTTMYMPPEAYQLESDDEKPKRFHPSKIDVYSFALICYSLLIGKPKPFQFQEMMKPSLRAWKDRVRNGHRPQLPKDSNCPCRLCTLIQRCWDGNPKKRPTFQDICTELRYIKGLLLAEKDPDSCTMADYIMAEKQERDPDSWTMADSIMVEVSDSTGDEADKIDRLLRKLTSSQPDMQRAAAGELRLLAKSNVENRICIADAGAIPLLVGLLSTQDLKTQEHSVTALLNLSINDNNKGAIVNAGAINPIVEVLKAGSKEARENAAATLFSLSVVDENKISIGNSGAIPALVDLLKTGTSRGKKDAATALFNLSIYQGNKARAVRAGVVAPLLELLEDANAGMVDEASAILAILATHQEGLIAIGQASAIPVLVDLIHSGSSRNKENAAAVLLALMVTDPANIEKARELGAYAALTDLASNGTTRAKRKATQLLEHMRKQEIRA